MVTWTEMRAQFREIAKLILTIEHKAATHGAVDLQEVELMAKTNELTPLGHQVLAEFVKASPKLILVEEGKRAWLAPNPDYDPLEDEEIDFDADERATTDVRIIIDPEEVS